MVNNIIIGKTYKVTDSDKSKNLPDFKITVKKIIRSYMYCTICDTIHNRIIGSNGEEIEDSNIFTLINNE